MSLYTALNPCIIARHNGLGGNAGFVLPVKARAGRTTQALGHFRKHKKVTTVMFNREKIFTEIDEICKHSHAVKRIRLYKVSRDDLCAMLPLLPHVQHICLNWYPETVLPDELWQCETLQALHVLNAPLESLPEHISERIHLRELVIRQGEMRTFPSWVSRMTSLVRLDFWQKHRLFDSSRDLK